MLNSKLSRSALSLILADMMSWQMVFWITAAFMLPGLACTLSVREPEVQGATPRTIRDAVVLPFTEFIKRDGWKNAILVLLFIFLYNRRKAAQISKKLPGNKSS